MSISYYFKKFLSSATVYIINNTSNNCCLIFIEFYYSYVLKIGNVQLKLKAQQEEIKPLIELEN